MTEPAHHWSASDYAFDAYADTSSLHEAEDFFPGERISAASAGANKAMRRGILFGLLALGGAYAWFGNPAALATWISASTASIASFIGSRSPPRSEPAATVTAPTAPQALASSDVPDAPAAAQLAAAPEIPNPPAPAATGIEQEAVAPLPPPVIDPADPYQKRAVSVGLHPDLSHVLLAKLSTLDYRNAGIAIRTAVAETPDEGVFVYPRKPKPELALFEVHFVPGAAADCRRYVVTVTKDGWLTTALPMEKCGAEARRTKHASTF
jgi:hypothetical protein